MITPELVARINELAKKQRSTGLSVSEQAEQAALRRVYIDGIKVQVKSHLDNAKEAAHTHNCGCGCGGTHKH
jgi:uncharacterized protein YnzC (UPF0291/DUF896 family)